MRLAKWRCAVSGGGHRPGVRDAAHASLRTVSLLSRYPGPVFRTAHTPLKPTEFVQSRPARCDRARQRNRRVEPLPFPVFPQRGLAGAGRSSRVTGDGCGQPPSVTCARDRTAGFQPGPFLAHRIARFLVLHGEAEESESQHHPVPLRQRYAGRQFHRALHSRCSHASPGLNASARNSAAHRGSSRQHMVLLSIRRVHFGRRWRLLR